MPAQDKIQISFSLLRSHFCTPGGFKYFLSVFAFDTEIVRYRTNRIRTESRKSDQRVLSRIKIFRVPVTLP
jgi:hypothetical protein